MPELLTYIATIAALSTFLGLCFQHGYIFDFWLRWVADQWLKVHDVDFVYDEQEFTANPQHYDNYEEALHEEKLNFVADRWKWFKPLGYCPMCLSVWLTLPVVPVVLGDGGLTYVLLLMCATPLLTQFLSSRL